MTGTPRPMRTCGVRKFSRAPVQPWGAQTRSTSAISAICSEIAAHLTGRSRDHRAARRRGAGGKARGSRQTRSTSGRPVTASSVPATSCAYGVGVDIVHPAEPRGLADGRRQRDCAGIALLAVAAVVGGAGRARDSRAFLARHLETERDDRGDGATAEEGRRAHDEVMQQERDAPAAARAAHDEEMQARRQRRQADGVAAGVDGSSPITGLSRRSERAR